MAKDGKNIVSEAVTDAKALKEAAMSAAKQQLVESLSPAIRELLEKEIKGVLDEKRGLTGRIGMSQRGDYFSPKDQKYEEAAEKGEPEMDMDKKDDGKKELDLESLAGFFPQMSEEPDADPMENMMGGAGMGEAPLGMGMPTLGEGGAEDDEMDVGGEDDLKLKHPGSQEKGSKHEGKDKEDDAMDETVEISEAELRKVYDAAMVAEVQVKKGFSDMTPMGELEDVVKDTGKGLNPEKKGDMPWEKGEAEDKKDWMVKEDVQSLIAQGLAENKALRAANTKLVEMVKGLGQKLHEVNLFNSKVLHVNRLLNKSKLTSEQRKVVLEKIDKAGTIAEVKMVYETIVDTFAAATQLSEGKSRKPVANAQRARTSGGADQKVLRESADRESNQGFTRLQQLAGLVK